MPAINWFPLVVTGGTGVAEARVESDGTVKLRGTITRTVVGTTAVALTLPASVKPPLTMLPIYIDWEATGLAVTIANPATYAWLGSLGFRAIGEVYSLDNVRYFSVAPAASARTLSALIAAMGTAIRAIPNLRVYDYPSDDIQSPAVVIDLPEVPMDRVKGDTFIFPVWLFLSRLSDRAAAKEVLAFVDSGNASAIEKALELDKTLGGQSDTLAVTEASPQIATVGSIAYLAVLYKVEVYT